MQKFYKNEYLKNHWELKRGPKTKMKIYKMAFLLVYKSENKIKDIKDLFKIIHFKGLNKLGIKVFCSYERFILNILKAKNFLNLFFSNFLEDLSVIGTIDSTMIPLSSNQLDSPFKNKQLRKEGIKKGYGTKGECFGLKLHLAVNHKGQVHNYSISSSNEHDILPVKKGLLSKAIGIVIADKGYISEKLKKELQEKSCYLLTGKRNNQEKPLGKIEKRIYQKRQQIEKIFSLLKSRFCLCPSTFPRRKNTAIALILGSLIAYQFHKAKHVIHINFNDFKG